MGHAMPLVNIVFNATTRGPDARRIADGVHRALVDAIGIPEGDRFQILNPREPDDLIFDTEYLSVSRRDVVYVQITLVGGRTTDQKRHLYRAIVENLQRANVRPEDVFITLTENGREDWSVGNGTAQLLDVVATREVQS